MTDALASPPVHLYQIAYSEQTLASIEPGYLALNNLGNPRPDWYEYWPIRRFLLNEPLDEAAFYGFFSPKFGSKTGMSHAQVCSFVRAQASHTDVCLFSPQPDMGAFFLNVFEQAETFDAGFIDAFSAFLATQGRADNLRTLVMDSRQIVFSNYFVARPAFWRTWLRMSEALFAACEGPDTPLRTALTHGTTYPGAAQRKVFAIERIASFLLHTEPRWRTRAANPFRFGWSDTRFRDHPLDAFMSDALKVAYRELGYPEFLHAYATVRDRFTARRSAA